MTSQVLSQDYPDVNTPAPGPRPIVALAPAPIRINWPGGAATYLAVEDGVYPGPHGDWEVWLEGEAVAWADTREQAERSFLEMMN